LIITGLRGAGGGLLQQASEQLAETFPKLGCEIEPLKVGKSIEVQLRCRSSDHGVEPPHSKEWHRLQFSEKRW
jgi:hypothetical protein